MLDQNQLENSILFPALFQSGGSGFTPKSLPGLQLWLRADRGTFQDSAKATSATSDGDVIGAWADQSGNGNDVIQATTSKKSLLKLSILNGRPVIRFDGTDDRLISSAFSLAQPISTFIVFKSVDLLASGYIAIDSFNDVACGIFRSGGNASFRIVAGGTQLATPGDNNWNIHGVEFDGASSIYYINGINKVSGDAGANGYSGLSIGDIRGNPNSLFANFELDGDIAEILIYNSILSAVNRVVVETYLNGRYAAF